MAGSFIKNYASVFSVTDCSNLCAAYSGISNHLILS